MPSTDQVKAQGPTTREWVEQVTRDPNEHLSYVYASTGIVMESGKTVVLYDRPDNHPSDQRTPHAGMNVLYNDGTAEFISGAVAEELLRRAASTQPLTTDKDPTPPSVAR